MQNATLIQSLSLNDRCLQYTIICNVVFGSNNYQTRVMNGRGNCGHSNANKSTTCLTKCIDLYLNYFSNLLEAHISQIKEILPRQWTEGLQSVQIEDQGRPPLIDHHQLQRMTRPVKT